MVSDLLGPLQSRVPDPDIEVLDPRLRIAAAAGRGRRAAGGRAALGRRPGVVRRRAFPARFRHPELPHPALGRVQRPGGGVPPAERACQRPCARRPGAAGQLRTPDPAHHPHRTRRPPHRAVGPLRRRAAQFAERHHAEPARRCAVVHRPRLRHRRLLRRGAGGRRAPPCGLSHRCRRPGRPPDRRPGRAERPRVFTPMGRCCT